MKSCHATVLALALVSGVANGEAFSGTVSSEGDTAIPFAFVGLLTPDFGLAAHTATDMDGAFAIETEAESKYVVVQPPPREDADGIGVYSFEPRIHERNGATEADIRLPDAGCLVAMAYDAEGRLLRWEDFMRRGNFGGQFMYAADLDDRMTPAAVWPVFDAEARALGSPREKGLPALVVAPDAPTVLQVLFWEVPGYGKVQLAADNAGEGYRLKTAGDHLTLRLNVEFARTAVHNLVRRRDYYSAEAAADIDGLVAALDDVLAKSEPVPQAAAADRVLADALDLRDRLELDAARDAASAYRKGVLRIEVRDASGQPVPGCSVDITQQSHDFRFGVFQGGEYREKAMSAARDAGFELATVLLAWGWSDAKQYANRWGEFDTFIGISPLRDLGFTVKTHGAVWLQEYGVLPDYARALPLPELHQAILEQQGALLDAFGDKITLWEAMNEPASTNTVDMPREEVLSLIQKAADAIKNVPETVTLINNPHEFDYGRKYMFYALDGQPVDDYNLTYLAFLEEAQKAGALAAIDVIGLQFYPGSHLAESLGGIEGPAPPPPWLTDTLDRYARFGLPVHITEFSVPASYGPDWNTGYWHEPSNETTQAEYAEAAFTLAFGHPSVQSITWWDVSDRESSVVTGGLLDTAGNPRPAYERIRQLIADWTTSLALITDDAGVAVGGVFGGEYDVEVQQADGAPVQASIHVPERQHVTLTIETGAS